MSVVLVVEDDPDLRDMMAHWLGTCGIRARVATDGLSALHLAHQEPRPSVVLLDLMMPVMSGWDFRREQLADPEIANIPVVIVSALSPVHYHDLAPAAVVPKPCEFGRLLDVVKRFL